jgi:hypothetical protein
LLFVVVVVVVVVLLGGKFISFLGDVHQFFWGGFIRGEFISLGGRRSVWGESSSVLEGGGKFISWGGGASPVLPPPPWIKFYKKVCAKNLSQLKKRKPTAWLHY